MSVSHPFTLRFDSITFDRPVSFTAVHLNGLLPLILRPSASRIPLSHTSQHISYAVT